MTTPQEQPTDVQLLYRFLGEETSMTALAKELGISKQLVSRRIRRGWTVEFGEPPPGKIIHPSQSQAHRDRMEEGQVLRLYSDGMFRAEISVVLGLHHSRVHRIITAAGMPLYRCRICRADVAPQRKHCDSCQETLRQSRVQRTSEASKRKRQTHHATRESHCA